MVSPDSGTTRKDEGTTDACNRGAGKKSFPLVLSNVVFVPMKREREGGGREHRLIDSFLLYILALIKSSKSHDR